MDNTSRYGTVELNESGRILKFEEKKAIPAAGVINAGIYIFNQEKINAFDFPQRFSIEKDFFEKQLQDLNIYGIVTDDYFIDIGIPEDYKKANEDFARFIH
jgi:D-glycero-alpha-D-manno-heptose 1-phosphate guanylyltransferase